MNIPAKEIKSRTQIGTLGKRAVFLVSLIGGLHLVAASTGTSQLEIMGAGSHKAVAQHLAKEKDPSIVYSSLAKADYVAPEHYAHLLPAYRELTDQLRAAQGY